MKIIVILQARYSSTRLPGKVLKPILDKPMLVHQIERIQRCNKIDKIIVATSTEPSDDAIHALCQQSNIACSRGSLDDVLDRFYQTNQQENADQIIRLTGDCPLIDPVIIDEVVSAHITSKSDYTNNCSLPYLPDGLDVEVFTKASLAKSWHEAKKPSEREHVTQYIRNNTAIFTINNITQAVDYSHLRWTVDEPEDFEFICKIFESLYPSQPHFNYHDVLTLLKAQPQLSLINKKFTRNEGLTKSLLIDKELGYE